jgi:lysozyme family protein
MSDGLAHSITLVFGSEGGYVNHPRDPGGATKYGVTAATLGAWRKLGRKATPTEVAGLALAEARAILDGQYAQPIRYADLPAPIDYCVFDEAVNAGPVRAARTLQACLGVPADGHIGIETLAALNAVDDRATLVRKLCARRLGFLRALPTWLSFGRGWRNRVAQVQATALAMLAR